MIKTGIWVIIIAAAFVAGTLATTNMAEAKNENNPDPVAAAIDRLTEVIETTAIQGAQGEQGPQGEQGEQGPVGQAFTQVHSMRYSQSNEDADKIRCTSDDDFIVHIYLFVDANNSYNLSGPTDTDIFSTTTSIQQSTPDRRYDGFTLGGTGGDRVEVFPLGGPNGLGISGWITMQTTEDAVADCQDFD